MPAADFAAAQERIAARRAQRAAAARTHAPPGEAALPVPFSRLNMIWDAVRGREGTRPEFRVGQVDAELLDDELLELLRAQVGEGLKHFGSHLADTYAPEILLGLRAVLFKLSVWNNNASYGAHLQGLRYADARSSAPSRPPPSAWQKAAYGAITVGGRYAWAKWEAHLARAADDYSRPASPRLTRLARLTEQLASAHDMASLASFLVFLANGRYRTLTDRLLRLRLTPASHSTSREVSFEYLNRQLVWHAFTEFLLFLLPLVGISRWRRILSRSLRRLRASFLSLLGRPTDPAADPATTTAELPFLPARTCAICYRDQNPDATTESDLLAAPSAGGVLGSAATDITNPYAASCGCVYCFACLAQRIANEEGEGWTCLRCGSVVHECAPWNGDVLEPRHPDEPREEKSVLFAQLEDEDEGLRHVEPRPDEVEVVEKTLDLGRLAFTERDEWARESGYERDEARESGYERGEARESGYERDEARESGYERDEARESDHDQRDEDSDNSDNSDQQSEEYDEDEEAEGEELDELDYDA